MPLSSSGPASSTTRLPAASRYAVGPTRISPGRAASWSRAARFTASPVAKVESDAVDDDLARLDPDAGLELELVHRRAHRERRARRAERIVLVRLRNAERGHHGVAGELLDDAAVLDDAVRDHLEEPR